jgi:hypothetical protein
MALLDKALRDEGFLLMRTPVKTGGDNPALIASRCALLDGGSFALDGEFQATVVQADGETRSARYVELPLGPTADAPTLGLIVTQLHHRNHHSGDPSRGLRAAEVACALEACRTRGAGLEDWRRALTTSVLSAREHLDGAARDVEHAAQFIVIGMLHILA